MNYKRFVLLFNIIFLLILITATILFEWKPGMAGTHFKPVDILSDVWKDTVLRSGLTKKGLVDPKENTAKSKGEARDYITYQGLINNSANRTALFDFYHHLRELEKKKRRKIRIGYFGDSMVEGDLITQDLRRMLQEYFGGGGVGFVPVTSIVAGFRQTIIHSFSSNWDDVSYKSDNKSTGDLFLSGHSYFSAGNSQVTYRAVNQPRLNEFNNVTILFGSDGGLNSASTQLVVNGNDYKIATAQLINKLELSLHSTEVKLSINSTSIPLYGAAFEADSGIVLDNFAFRGISGVELDYFSEKYLQQVQAVRPYDLVIFHFGPNLLFKPNQTEFGWYAKKMQPTLQKLKNSFPQTSLLLISTADKGSRTNGEWHTQKGVQPLIDVQYSMANNTGIDFFNLYNAMGGEDAMVRWVNAEPSLAGRDYTHPNHNGAKKIAEYIYNAIMKEYKEYEKFADK